LLLFLLLLGRLLLLLLLLSSRQVLLLLFFAGLSLLLRLLTLLLSKAVLHGCNVRLTLLCSLDGIEAMRADLRLGLPCTIRFRISMHAPAVVRQVWAVLVTLPDLLHVPVRHAQQHLAIMRHVLVLCGAPLMHLEAAVVFCGTLMHAVQLLVPVVIMPAVTHGPAVLH
jgi:hypothetical protein